MSDVRRPGKTRKKRPNDGEKILWREGKEADPDCLFCVFSTHSCRYTKRTKDTPYHYFDAVKGVTSVHSFDLAIDVYKSIGQVLPLSLK